MERRRFMLGCGAAALLGGASTPGWAQKLGVARIITGFPAGSTVDVFARTVADKLTGTYAENLVVENRVGGGGQIAVTSVRREKPDGSVLLMTPIAMMSVYPFTYGKLGYDPIADFTPLSRGTVYDRCFAVGSMVPATIRTIAEFGAWAKEHSQYAAFGSPAAGSPLHFTGVLLGRQLGVELLHVPYRGTVHAVPDLAEGRLPSYIAPLGDVLKYAGDGRIRIVGTSGSQRSPFAPQIPTFEEQGLKGLGMPEAYTFFGPARMPADVAEQVSGALRQALLRPEIKQLLTPLCMEPSPSSPAELGAELRASMDAWGPVVRSIGFRADG